MSNTQPFISVIIPNYNHSLFLNDRINSVLSQTYDNFELILLDDCSTDNSVEILDKFSIHPKVSHFEVNNENSGSNYIQWNKGVALAKGDLIWIAESDDTCSNHFLEKLVPSFLDDKVMLAYSQSNRMNFKGEIVGDWFFQTDMMDKSLFDTSFTMKGVDFIEQFLLKKNVIPNASAVLFRRTSFELVLGANENVKYCADWLLWLNILVRNGNVYYTNEKLNNFRYLDTSVIGSSIKTSPIPFVKRYDIFMRKEFNQVLKELKVKVVLNYNTKLLVKEIIEEVHFLSKKQRSRDILTLFDYNLFFMHFSLRQKMSFFKHILYSILF